MNEIKLRDPDQYPTNEILRNVLGEAYPLFDELIQVIAGQEYSLEPLWNYYKDGKAWLCKVVFKKKTIFWLSVWDSYFKTAFYFTEKTGRGIDELDIENNIKTEFHSNEMTGKLIPLVFEIRKKEQISDLLKVVNYKKSLK